MTRRRTLTPAQIRQLRTVAQRLAPQRREAVADASSVVGAVFAVQSQELAAAHLAIRARSTDLTDDAVRRAREDDRSIILTWTLRGTMHLTTTDDLRWLLPTLGPVFIKKTARRYKQLGLTAAIRAQALDDMRAILPARGPLIRADLATALAARGVPVEGQAIAHLVRYAALEGVVCFGPQVDGELTYVLIEAWLGDALPPPLDETEFSARLAEQYLRAYGPATVDDFAKWAGIPMKWARGGFEHHAENLVAVDILGEQGVMLREQEAWLDETPAQPVVRLLPRYDTYLLGYGSRDFMVAEAHAKAIHPGGGQIQQTVIVDGWAVGTWRTQRKKDALIVTVDPFNGPLDEAVRAGIDAEVADLARFLGHNVESNG